MDINFERSRVQKEIENIIDSSYDPSIKDRTRGKIFSQKAQNYIVGGVEALTLENKIQQDRVDYLYNGIISLVEGINNIYSKKFSWGAIKLYYSLFYLSRAILAYNNIALLRINGIVVTIKCKEGEKIKGFKKNKRSTHEGTFYFFKEENAGNYILSNNIDGQDCFDWYKSVRDIINYKAVSFYEPDYLSLFNNFDTEEKLNKYINRLFYDQDGIIFQEEYAIIGIPLKFLSSFLNDINLKIKDIFSNTRLDYIKSISNEQLKKILDIKK